MISNKIWLGNNHAERSKAKKSFVLRNLDMYSVDELFPKSTHPYSF